MVPLSKYVIKKISHSLTQHKNQYNTTHGGADDLVKISTKPRC